MKLSWLMVPLLALSLALPPAAAAAGPKPYVTLAEAERPLAQGLTVRSFERLYPSGWVKGWLLSADLADPSLRSDLVTSPALTGGEVLSAMAGRAGAVAALNGDFFDIGQTGIALGSVVRGGEFLQSRIPDWPNAAGVGRDRIGRLVDVALEGSVTLPGGSYKLGAINLPTVPANSIGLFTPLWTISRERALFGASEGREVVVRKGRVVSVSEKVTEQPVPADGFVLVGREGFARPLAALKVGDPVSVSYRPRPDLQWALGGRQYLVRKGQIAADLDDAKYGPRSALGFSRDGRRMLLLAVDGRSAESGGLTLQGLAEMMLGFGATDVLELDGGGSVTMVVRRPGEPGLSVVNQPSDGRERSIPNGVALFAAPGSGVAASLEILGEARVFPGLSRRLTVRALDEQYTLARVGATHWEVYGSAAISPDGRLRATYPGRATVTARALRGGMSAGRLPPAMARIPGATVSGRLSVRVLGALDRIAAEGEGLRLAPGETGELVIRGYDADGYSATIDPLDLTLTYDRSLLRVETSPEAIRLTPLKEGAGLIKVSVQGKAVQVPFASTRTKPVLDLFDHPDRWRFQKYPATVSGALAPAPGRTGNGLKLTYTFGSEGVNRAAYAQAASPLELPEKPEKLGLWVRGDGKGAWLRAVLLDAKGASHTLNLARRVDWTGWRYVEAPVPAGVAYPVKLHRIYPVETDPQKQYSGELVFDDLTVRTLAALPPLPPAPVARPDPILSWTGPAGQDSWSFALLGGMAESEAEAQRLIRGALAAAPAFLLVDPALMPASGEALLAKEAGRMPIHRITKPASRFDLKGVRFLLLSTQGGGLRTAQFDQLLALKSMLDAARLDPGVRRVVVVAHHAPGSFADRREADLVAGWLTEFEERSGKEAVYLATGGKGLTVERKAGIPYIELGSPQAPVLLTIDLTPGVPWIRVKQP
ncbi:MAG: phosphodiester glycosidase family protein [Bacillota bacterium]